MNIKKYGFTLIELLVGISISVILMISVSVFVSSGMKNILDINKVLKNSGDFNDFSSNLLNTFNYTGSGKYIKVISQTGVLFKRDQYFDKGGFSYVGETSIDKFYCASGSESPITKHIILKTFIPFEENGENMFSNGGYEKIFTGSSDSSNTYISYALEHVVKDNAEKIIIGKGIYGGPLPNPPPGGEGISGTGIYLNNPTGLAMSGTSILFVSDTLNNRVLYYDTSTKKIYKLLDEFDGLLEPTGLYYNAGKLYISNSGKGEILEYSSPVISTPPIFTMSGFSETINEINISFSGSNLPNLTNTGIFNITGNSTTPNYLTGTSDNLKYYFIAKQSESIQSSCTLTETKFVDGRPSIYCTKAGSGQLANYPTSTISQIKINNLNGFNNTGSYYVNLKLLDSSNSVLYQEYFPYFTQGDNNILTPGDNTLIVFKSGLSYPTGIWNSSGIKYNEFEKESNGTTERNYNFQNTGYNSISDYILKTPLKSLIVDKTGNLLTIFLKYYKNYNCYNLDDNAQRSYVLKKKF